jgi:hypothetical protein
MVVLKIGKDYLSFLRQHHSMKQFSHSYNRDLYKVGHDFREAAGMKETWFDPYTITIYTDLNKRLSKHDIVKPVLAETEKLTGRDILSKLRDYVFTDEFYRAPRVKSVMRQLAGVPEDLVEEATKKALMEIPLREKIMKPLSKLYGDGIKLVIFTGLLQDSVAIPYVEHWVVPQYYLNADDVPRSDGGNIAVVGSLVEKNEAGELTGEVLAVPDEEERQQIMELEHLNRTYGWLDESGDNAVRIRNSFKEIKKNLEYPYPRNGLEFIL